jgi:hypothetical protein
MQIVMNPPASDAAILCLLESCQYFLRVEINKIKVSRKLQNHLNRRIRVQADGQSSASEGRKNFRKGMGPRETTFLVQSGSKEEIGRRLYQGAGIPIRLHRASRSARMASDTVFRFSFCGNIRNPSFVRTGWTRGTSFSTSSTTLMLPSAWRSAENGLRGVNNSLHAKRPFSSAISFTMGLSHQLTYRSSRAMGAVAQSSLEPSPADPS